MKIIYLDNGTIISNGEITENSTHYINKDTYFDKKTCNITEIETIENFVKQDWKYENGVLTNIKKNILSKAEFFKLLTWDEQLKIRNYRKYIVEEDKLEAFTVLYENFKDFKEVDLSDIEWCTDFSQVVIWCGILTVERVNEIIGG